MHLTAEEYGLTQNLLWQIIYFYKELEIKLPTSTGSSKKTTKFQINIYFYFIDYSKTFDCMDHKKLWKILNEMGMPDHLT